MSEIDVSKCKHYRYDGIKKPLCRSGGCTGVYKSCLCVENTDCDYRQLQQLKAENEELRNLHINLVGVKECEIKEISKYKTALDEIEEIAKGTCRKKCGKNNACLDTHCGYGHILQLIKQVKEGE